MLSLSVQSDPNGSLFQYIRNGLCVMSTGLMEQRANHLPITIYDGSTVHCRFESHFRIYKVSQLPVFFVELIWKLYVCVIENNLAYQNIHIALKAKHSPYMCGNDFYGSNRAKDLSTEKDQTNENKAAGLRATHKYF